MEGPPSAMVRALPEQKALDEGTQRRRWRRDLSAAGALPDQPPSGWLERTLSL